MTGQAVSAEYCAGIVEGRDWLNRYGMDDAKARLDNLTATARTFAASSPVGQMLRGERDFWRNQIKKHANAGVA